MAEGQEPVDFHQSSRKKPWIWALDPSHYVYCQFLYTPIKNFQYNKPQKNLDPSSPNYTLLFNA